MISAILTLPLIALAQATSPPSLPPLAQAPAKPVFAPTPVPPPPPAPGTEAYERQRAGEARRLREACYSEAAIELIMIHEERMRAVPPEAKAADAAALTELGEAAYTMPLDIDRLERAVQERARLQAEDQARWQEARLALLRKLPPADQVIYAQGFSVLKPWPPLPPRTCPGSLAAPARSN
jgi:hypothetical protein